MRLVRVFPRQTKATPVDDLAYAGPPDLFVQADEVHVSVAFTYDIPLAERLAEQLPCAGDVMSADPEFRRRLSRLMRVKIQEIKDGCLLCQGKAKASDGTLGCGKHQQLFISMTLNPRKYADELLRPGDGDV